MIKKTFILLVMCLLLLINTSPILAATKGAGDICNPAVDTCPSDYSCQKFDEKTSLCQKSTLGAGEICNPSDSSTHCISGYSCQPIDSKTYACQKSSVNSIFGQIKPPDALKGLINKDPTGAGGLSTILSNLIQLFYVAAAVVLIFMLLWGAFDWMTSEGNKEKLESARNKILNAIVGIILFAVAFAVINVLGQFTGFTFFTHKSAAGCPVDSFYFDTNEKQCIHKVYSTVNGQTCQEVFVPVTSSFCGQ